MARPARHVRYTLADYVATEAASPLKHEFLDGHIYAMAGGTPEHAALAAAVTRLLALPRGCRIYSSDLRVRVAATGLVTYPDVTVVCGRLERDPEDVLAICNPTVLVEILSPRTADYDRGEKWEHYQQLASLRAYLLVDWERPMIEVRARPTADAPWTSTVAGPGGTARVAVLEAALVVDEVYRAAQEEAGS